MYKSVFCFLSHVVMIKKAVHAVVGIHVLNFVPSEEVLSNGVGGNVFLCGKVYYYKLSIYTFVSIPPVASSHVTSLCGDSV